MDKNIMSEELYVLSNNEVVKRRKPLTQPFILALVGALLLGMNWMIAGEQLGNLQAALVLFGGALFLWGAGVVLYRLISQDGVPYYPASGKYLVYQELCFPKESMNRVLALSCEGKIEELRKLSNGSIPAVVVALYCTPDGELTAWQPFEYVDLEYRPLDDMRLKRA